MSQMILKRCILFFLALLMGVFAFGIVLNPWINHNPDFGQTIARYLVGAFSGGGTLYIVFVAIFSSDDYIDANVTWAKFLDRL